MRPPRGLTADEAALWRKVASTVKPLVPPPTKDQPTAREGAAEGSPALDAADQLSRALAKPAGPARAPAPPLRGGPALRSAEEAKPRPLDRQGLDGGWERKLSRGLLDPDFTLDLHGASLDAAHGRLTMGLSQARAMNARVVLLITGRPRPVEAADRGHARGAIRAKVVDWLAAGEHGGDIAAIRGAHRRHGGAGALYLVLKKRR